MAEDNQLTPPSLRTSPLDKRRIWITLGIVIVVLGGLVALVVSRSTSAPTNNRVVKVVAGENFWGSIAAQIGGSHAEVTSIISDPNADPHLYESDAHDAIAVAGASVVIENGLGYDDFMSKLLSTSSNAHRRVLVAANILQVTGSDPNPHLWYDIPRVPQVAAQIEAALVAQDPADRAVFAQNLATFDASLQPILTVVSQIKAQYPGAPVAYTERVPGYLLADAGLSVKTPTGFASAIEDGTDPSPADTTAMDKLMTTHAIKVLLYNAQATSPVTEQVGDLARQNGIPVIGVTETLPAGEPTYQAWQLSQVTALLKALSQ